MPSSSTSTILGWSLSFLIYFLVILIVTFTLQSDKNRDIKYTAQKKNLLNITLVERTKKGIQRPKKKKVVKKKTTVQKPKPKKSTPKIKRVKKNSQKPNFKKLFEKIDIEKLPKENQKREQKIRKKVVQKEIVEVKKSEIAKKITKSLEFEKQESLIVTSKDGVYDEFKGKIADILEANWQSTIDTVSGNEAEVIIGIDKFGKFSYKIETLSYNDAFNAKLRDFLEEMRDTEFPPFKGGEIFYMKTKFKDILE